MKATVTLNTNYETKDMWPIRVVLEDENGNKSSANASSARMAYRRAFSDLRLLYKAQKNMNKVQPSLFDMLVTQNDLMNGAII